MTLSHAFGVWSLPAALPETTGKGGAGAAVERFRTGSPAAAVDMARTSAEDGDADACFLLAYAMEDKEPAKLSRGQAMEYYYGKAAIAGHPEAGFRRNLVLMTSGSEKERSDSRQALEVAAERDPRAGRVLGEAWLRGFVTGKPDVSKAEEYWKASGSRGDAESLILLARLREGDFGFPELTDGKAALGFFREAAMLGDVDAFVPLGSMLLNNGENPGDAVEGREWLEKAAGKKIPAAWLVLGDYEQMVKKDEKAAMDFHTKGAEAGDPECMMRIAARSSGDAERRSWLAKASEAGSPAASAELGRLMLKEGNPYFSVARRYLISAAREGVSTAQYDLAMFYLEGRDGAPDAVSAMAWLTAAMKSGEPDILYQLAVLHEQGIGGPVNYANAGVLHTMACNKGHAAAATRIAGMAMEGLGTTRDLAQAKAHATLAVERGDITAKKILTELEGKLDAGETAKAEKTLAQLHAVAKAPRNKGGEKSGDGGR